MKIYRTKRNGVNVWRLAGVMGRGDAVGLVRAMKGRGGRIRGCHVLDFTDIAHVDYQAFRMLEERLPAGAGIVLSGLSDYVLDIFAFIRRKGHFAIYDGWREALRHIRLDRGKMITGAAHNYAGFK
jgi:hypothetical protein